jgi:hypothetical protein
MLVNAYSLPSSKDQQQQQRSGVLCKLCEPVVCILPLLLQDGTTAGLLLIGRSGTVCAATGSRASQQRYSKLPAPVQCAVSMPGGLIHCSKGAVYYTTVSALQRQAAHYSSNPDGSTRLSLAPCVTALAAVNNTTAAGSTSSATVTGTTTVLYLTSKGVVGGFAAPVSDGLLTSQQNGDATANSSSSSGDHSSGEAVERRVKHLLQSLAAVGAQQDKLGKSNCCDVIGMLLFRHVPKLAACSFDLIAA